jgi:hypothetical protein
MVNGGKRAAWPLSSASPFPMDVSIILLFAGSRLDEEVPGPLIALGSLGGFLT